MIEKIYTHPELMNCPIETTFKIIGPKWTVLIIREMLCGTTKFNLILENVDGLSPKTCAQRLKALQKLGIVQRRIVSESPIRIEYRLTDLGKRLEPLLSVTALFSTNFMSDIMYPDIKKPRFFDEFCRH